MKKNTNQPKNVLITGCSSGFGFLTALKLAEEGCKVYATMRNLKKSRPLLDEASARKVTLQLLRLDVTDASSIKRALRKVEEQDGKLHVLINNAGYGMAGFFEDISDREFRDQMETNFFGVLNVTRAALPLLRKAEGAKIINMSSVSGYTAFPALTPYHASKWALEGFSESLRLELKHQDIEVVLLEPSAYRTKALKENARFAAGAVNPKSIYYPYSRMMLEAFERRNGNLRNDPNDIPDRITSILRHRRNKLRHIIGRRGKTLYWVRRLIPFRLMEWFINRFLFRKADAAKPDEESSEGKR
jgi:NAD(P)-dependent dehydrogenase (short-subunit alcohol dehydrogenase family)